MIETLTAAYWWAGTLIGIYSFFAAKHLLKRWRQVLLYEQAENGRAHAARVRRLLCGTVLGITLTIWSAAVFEAWVAAALKTTEWHGMLEWVLW